LAQNMGWKMPRNPLILKADPDRLFLVDEAL
jgi:hypothetical protein